MSEMIERVRVALQKHQTVHGPYYEGMARAAVEAMREPTAAILSTMRDDLPVDGHEWEWLDDQAENYWRAMIDAALKEAP